MHKRLAAERITIKPEPTNYFEVPPPPEDPYPESDEDIKPARFSNSESNLADTVARAHRLSNAYKRDAAQLREIQRTLDELKRDYPEVWNDEKAIALQPNGLNNKSKATGPTLSNSPSSCSSSASDMSGPNGMLANSQSETTSAQQEINAIADALQLEFGLKGGF